MDKKTYELLKQKLDLEQVRLQANTLPTGLPHSVGTLIHKNMDVSTIEEEKLPLIHSMLHMFYQRKGGKGLSMGDIITLHKEVVKRLPDHKNFDRLDENGLY